MRLIDGDSLADVLTAISSIRVDTGRAEEWAVTIGAARQAIAQMPTIKPKTGKWINDDDDWWYPQCSVCGKNALEVQECGFKSNYCPHCGARMENSDDSN